MHIQKKLINKFRKIFAYSLLTKNSVIYLLIPRTSHTGKHKKYSRIIEVINNSNFNIYLLETWIILESNFIILLLSL